MAENEAPSSLTSADLCALVRRVFEPGDEDREIAVLVDLPDRHTPDTPQWRERRHLAMDWARKLAASRDDLGLETSFFVYRNVRANNADLPEQAWFQSLDEGAVLPADADGLDEDATLPFEQLFRRHQILIAPTHFSATAPLKLAAPRYAFRAATMPGFGASMIPTLKLDYGEINRRVSVFKRLLDAATGADLRFEVDGKGHALHLDLRHRTSHASGGLLPKPGHAGNLPSGETYIVPYEGEIEGDPSRSQGVLPVQFGDEVVLYEIIDNRAVAVLTDGPASRREKDLLEREPAYANLAELGLGVLADFGVQPIGEILLDEKLGLHIAFGRSDHFGGQVGAADFSAPEAVIHIDRVYLPATQPAVRVRSLDLLFPGDETRPLIRDDRFVIWDAEDAAPPPRPVPSRPSRVVVAIGGNAISRAGSDDSVRADYANLNLSLESIVYLIEEGYEVVLTHGNGPQVGNQMIRVEAAHGQAPDLPLDVVVADLQGGLGYMIEQVLYNKLRRLGIDRPVCGLFTLVEVDPEDPAFDEPTKFVGPPYPADRVAALTEERGWLLKEDRGRGWRRVVPSPHPISIIEHEAILTLVESGALVIAAGGGGIPVSKSPRGALHGVEGVIDKDLAAAVLARDVGAEELYILTAVEQVSLDFGTDRERPLDRLRVAEARRYMAEGQFPAGSMGPKMEAVCRFIENGGRRALITDVLTLTEAMNGTTGTWILP